MFVYNIPSIVKSAFPKLIWEKNDPVEESNKIYFTFDDGPTPEITNFVLDELNKVKAKATFFCIGKNILGNEKIIQDILANGSSIGNHTMNHLNAWKVSSNCYQENIEQCNQVFMDNKIQSIGFRPPYGRINYSIYQQSSLTNIYMWSVLTGDYRKELKANDILNNCLPALKPGKIVVFHDSLKAFHNLKVILPVFLEASLEKGLVPSAL